MAKLEDVGEDTQKVFNELINESNIPSFVRIKLLDNDKIKDNGKVSKANDILKHMTDFDIIIQINERIFDQLDEDQQKIIAEELLGHIYFDMDKSTIKLVKPDLTTFSGLIVKHGIDKYLAVTESIKTLIAAQKEAEKD